MFWEMAKPGVDRAAMATLLDGLQHEKVGAVLLLGHFMFAIGVILLGVALWRAAVTPRWAVLLATLFPVTDVLVGFPPIDGAVGDILSNAFGIVGFAALGLRLITSPDTAWDAPAVASQLRAAQSVPA